MQAFKAAVHEAQPSDVSELCVAATLTLRALCGAQELVFRQMRRCSDIDPAAMLRSHEAVFRILNLAGAGHLVMPAALIDTPAPVSGRQGEEFGGTGQIMVTAHADRAFLPFRNKGGMHGPLAEPTWAELSANEDRTHAALAGYLTVQQDMLWTNLVASPRGGLVLFDFDNCLRRSFPFTATKPIFFHGGPLGYENDAAGRAPLSRRAEHAVAALSRTSPSELAERWRLQAGEAEIIVDKAQRVTQFGLSAAVASDPDYRDHYWDAPPWWGQLERQARAQREQRTGWRYNDYYDQHE